jgi:16S rRNA (uracil1498-N3)-methyltransferase
MARERRFLVADLDAARVEIVDDEAHHLIHVLRLHEGDTVALFDGDGRAANATIARIADESVELNVGDALPANESPLQMTLAVAVPKGDTMSLIVQKLTELGVTSIQPLISDNSEVSAEAIVKRIERWERIALEAAKQSGRSRLPRVEPPRTFEELAREGAWLLSPGASPFPATKPTNPLVFVGPEGGWSEPELELAFARKLVVFGLGPRTLRTETAAIAAATVMQWLSGDLR